MNEKYSIHVYDEIVEVYGNVWVKDAHHLLDFFSKQGFELIILGHENSSLRLERKNFCVDIISRKTHQLEEELEVYKEELKKEKEQREFFEDKCDTLQTLLIEDNEERKESLKKKISEYLKFDVKKKLESNDKAKEIIDRYHTPE
jgi:uncharacterized membrane-anchored protein YjiN (DUF445 family)